MPWCRASHGVTLTEGHRWPSECGENRVMTQAIRVPRGPVVDSRVRREAGKDPTARETCTQLVSYKQILNPIKCAAVLVRMLTPSENLQWSARFVCVHFCERMENAKYTWLDTVEQQLRLISEILYDEFCSCLFHCVLICVDMYIVGPSSSSSYMFTYAHLCFSVSHHIICAFLRFYALVCTNQFTLCCTARMCGGMSPYET